MKEWDVVLVGGGAAGLAAAVTLSRGGLSVVLCERGSRVGKKLLATGSGTCNLSNIDLAPSHYHSLAGDGASFASSLLSSFSHEKAGAFFRSVGIEIEPDNRGRLYPICRSAGAVLDCLRLSYLSEGAEELTNFEAVRLQKKGNGYLVTAADGRAVQAKYVLLAMGGAAAPGLGGVDASYRLLSPFGVTGTKQYPSVTALKTDTRFTRALKGLRANARLTLHKDGQILSSCNDEVLFTDSGLSGPAAFALARDVSLWEENKQGDMRVSINFLHGLSSADILLCHRYSLNRPLEDLLTGLFHKRVGQTLLRYADISSEGRKADQLTVAEKERISKAITAFDLSVFGTTGLRDAQVTVGGLNLKEIDPDTMEVRKCPGVFAAGEMLDVDGDCGGYNLHLAFAGGICGAEAIIRSVKAEQETNTLRLSSVRLPIGYDETTDLALRRAAAKALFLPLSYIRKASLARRSVDARNKADVFYLATLEVEVADAGRLNAKRLSHVSFDRPSEPSLSDFLPPSPLSHANGDSRIAVIGCGPAGLFAAYLLAAAGLRPLLLERGREVDRRTADIRRFDEGGQPDFTSNALFGEGGAGTFSDGKLHTGIHDPRCRFVLKTLHECGAPEEILWHAMPHVGTDRLTETVKNLRKKIVTLGGEVCFEHHVTDFHIENGHLVGLTVKTPDGIRELPVSAAILACGHSARDTYEVLVKRGVPLSPKAFAVGVRIEHPRAMIDRSQYGDFAGSPGLGAAPYKLVSHTTKERGVYTFCMCPGGQVIPCVSEPNHMSVNGMSAFARDKENSNSALLVGVSPSDFGVNPLDGIAFQRKLEESAFSFASDYCPPIQRVDDFLAKRVTRSLGDVTPSCVRGTVMADLHDCLPSFITDPLSRALPDFGRQIKGFDRPDALLVGVEARSSAPVRLLRNDQCESPIQGLYPCGEGAGYAGGITSAAVDGMRVAEAVMTHLENI